jgi:hypothetical protein
MIRARYLDALETERFELLPEGPYLRSFLREYSEYLGLDGDIFVTEYMLRFPPPEPEPETVPSHGFLSALGGVPRGALVAVGAIAAIAAIGAWQLEKDNGPAVRSAAPPPQSHTAGPAPSLPAAAPAVTKTAERTHVATAFALTAVRGSCWLQVRVGSSSGRVVAEQTLRPGQTARFGLAKPLWIRLGAPWNVDASLGRRSVTASLPTRTGNVLVSAASVAAA